MIDFLWIWMRIETRHHTVILHIIIMTGRHKWQAQSDYMISITIQIKQWSLNDWFNNDHCFISMIGWWIWIVLSICGYQHLTIACPSGVCGRCCTYGLTRTQVNVLQSQCVCVCVCVCVCHTWKCWSASNSPICCRSSPLVWPTLPAACKRFCRGWKHTQ